MFGFSRVKVRLVFLWALLAAAPLYAEPHAVDGNLSAFAYQNYGYYSGSDGFLVGERLDSSITGPLWDRRLLRYRLSGLLLDGRIFGLADRVTLLDRRGRLDLTMLPLHWYTLNLFGEYGATNLDDGPIYTFSDRDRTFGANLEVAPRSGRFPRVSAKYDESQWEFSGARSDLIERRRGMQIFAIQQVVKSTQVDATYQLYNTEELRNEGIRVDHRANLHSFSRFSSDTTLSLYGRGAWHDAELGGRQLLNNRSVGAGTSAYHRLDVFNEFQGSGNFDLLTGPGLYAQSADINTMWYHRLFEFMRTGLGAEFAHSATDGVVEGFAYQKYREAAILGANLRKRVGDFEVAPSYYVALGAVQVQDAEGGTYQRQGASLPISSYLLPPLPMSLTGTANFEVDDSDVPTSSLTRALEYRFDFYSYAGDRSGVRTTLTGQATRLRTDRNVFFRDERIDRTTVLLRDTTSIDPMASQFYAEYGVSWNRSDQLDQTVHMLGFSWGFIPVASMTLRNSAYYSKTFYPTGFEQDRLTYIGEFGYWFRNMELSGKWRYTSYDDGAGEWGTFVEIRRRFGFQLGT